MKIQMTITYTYEIDENSKQTLDSYGTQDPAGIIAVDRDQFEDDIMIVAEHIDLTGGEYALTMRQI